MIDSHCHLDFEVFDDDRASVLKRCKELGIDRILIPGTRSNSWQTQRQLQRKFDQLDIAYGLHPYFLDKHDDTALDALERALDEHRDSVVAVGEIGLDFAIDVEKKKQRRFFEAQLELATQFSLPVIIHHRKSHNEIIRLLKHLDFSNGGVVHAFSGSMHEAQTYQELGFKLGAGGTVTYARAQKTREVFQQVDACMLLLETDAPDMPLCGQQGQRNSPEYIPQVLDCLAELRQQSASELDIITSENYAALFHSTRQSL